MLRTLIVLVVLLGACKPDRAQTEGVRDGDEPPFRFGIICCAMRMFTAGFGPYFRDLLAVVPKHPPKEVYGIASMALARSVVDARDRLGLPVVGFDLAGAEAGHPASDRVKPDYIEAVRGRVVLDVLSNEPDGCAQHDEVCVGHALDNVERPAVDGAAFLGGLERRIAIADADHLA